jgi:WD40 repeat protein
MGYNDGYLLRTPAGSPLIGYLGLRDSPGGGGEPEPPTFYLAAGHSSSPFVNVFKIIDGEYDSTFANPATLPPNECITAVWRPQGDVLLVGFYEGTDLCYAYHWSAAGFGALFSDPSVENTGNFSHAGWTPSGGHVAIANEGGSPTPQVDAFAWSAGFGARVTDPVGLGGAGAFDIAWSPDGAYVAVALGIDFGGGDSIYIAVYPWTGSAFGAKYADPAALPVGANNRVVWHPSGSHLAVAHSSGAPFASVYPWSVAGFGVRVTAPVTPIPSSAYDLSWHPDGTYVAVCHELSPFISVYEWTGTGFGAKVANPVSLPAGVGHEVAWSPDGTMIALSVDGGQIALYEWTGSGFGAKAELPATGNVYQLAWLAA